MLDMNFIRNNPEAVKENIRKKFQDQKVPLVDELIELDRQYRALKTTDDNLRAQRNAVSKQIGQLMKQQKKDEAEQAKLEVGEINKKLAENETTEEDLFARARRIQMQIPNMIADDVPIGPDDSCNVEDRRFGGVVWRCRCDCGNEVNVRGNDLVNGNRRSCGKCLPQEKSRTMKVIDQMLCDGMDADTILAALSQITSAAG